MQADDRARLSEVAIRLALPLATFVSLSILATSQDGIGAAETGFLAILSVLVLLPTAALTTSPALDLGISAAAISLAAWVIPPGPARGSACTLLLIAVLAISSRRRWAAAGTAITWASALPAAIAVQFLFRGDELLALSLKLVPLARLVGLPLIGAVAVTLLARRFPAERILIATAALLVAGDGWSTASTLTLLSMAAAAHLDERTLPLAMRILALLVPLGAASLRDPRLAVVILASACALFLRKRPHLLAPVGVVVIVIAGLWPDSMSWTVALQQLAWLPLLLPAALVSAGRRWSLLTIAVVVAAAGLRMLPPETALAAPLALASLGLSWQRPARELQGVWSGALLLGSLALASYPWLREPVAVETLRLVSLESSWPAALALTLLAAVLVLALRNAERHAQRWRLSPTAVGLALVAIGACVALPGVAIPLLEHDVIVLDANFGRWSADPADRPELTELVAHTYLAASASLPVGTPIATLRVTANDGRFQEWTLRAHQDSGEWAARRPDVASLSDFHAPSSWLSWVAPDGFFAQRYRSAYRLETPLAAATVSIERSQQLPPKVTLVVFQVEMRS